MREHVKGQDAFIALKEGPFKAFRDGTKWHELRPCLPRWSDKNYPIGKLITLSWGYAKKNRLYGTIRSHKCVEANALDHNYQKGVLEHYGTLDMKIYMIGIDLEPSVERDTDNGS